MENKTEIPQQMHCTRLRVPLYEISLGQAVYHGNYYHLFEIARENFFRDAGFPYKQLMDMERHLTVARAVCDYRKSLVYDDIVDIHTGISWMRDRSLGIIQKIYRGDDLCTEIALNVVCVSFSGKPEPVPPDFRAAVSGCIQGRKPETPPDDEKKDIAGFPQHIARIRIPLYEIDLGQALYHGNYYHLFEITRERFFREAGFSYKKIMGMKRHLTLARAACNYKKPLLYDDIVDIHTGISWMRERSQGMIQRIYRDGILCTEIELTMVCINFSGKSCEIPPDFRAAVGFSKPPAP